MDFYASAVAQTNAASGVLGSSLWPILFFAIASFFLIYSGVLIFHWVSYSMHPRTTVMATILYFGVSAIFIFSMLVSAVTLVTL